MHKRHSTKQIGDSGEDLAVDYLIGQGYRIIKRNYRSRYAEIDIIALDGDTLCFIEVKRKSHDGFGVSADMITARKRSKIINAAQYYVADNELEDVNFRIDAVLIDDFNIDLVKSISL